MIPESEESNKAWIDKPRLRAVQVIPMASDDEAAIVLHDPARIAPGDIALSPGAMAVLQMMDGTNDLRDIQGAILREIN